MSKVILEAIEAKEAYEAQRGREPVYLVLGKLTYLRMCEEIKANLLPGDGWNGLVRVVGLTVVVLPADFGEALAVVGEPDYEAGL